MPHAGRPAWSPASTTRCSPTPGKAVVTLLRRLGVDVDFPAAQTCCGQPMVNTGYLDEAVPVVRTFVDAFAGYDAIVTPSGSCAGSARHQHAIVAAPLGRPGAWRRPSRETGAEGLRAHRVPRRRARGDRRRRVLPAPRDLPPDLPLAADARRRRPAAPAAARRCAGSTLVDLPGAEECCGFGGTFAVKNADTSVAMGADKARHVRETGAEVLVAGDNSCLMHIGGLLSRQRAGVRVDAPGRDPGARPRSERRHDRAPSSGCRPFPEAAARAALADTQLRAQPAHATAHDPRQARRGRRRGRRLGGAAAGRRGDQGATRCATSTSTCVQLEAVADRARAPPCTGPATPPRRARIVADGRAGPRRRRGRQGQVDGHPGDRPQRGARRPRASPPGRPTSPS